MEVKFKILVGLLIVSLALNMYSIVKTNQLTHELQMQNNHHVSNDRQVGQRLSAIEQDIREFAEAEKWVSEIAFYPDHEHSSPGDIHLEAEWTFNEVERDADVMFMYKSEEDTDWIESVATHVSGTTFQTSIQLDPDNTYMYKVSSKGSINKGMQSESIPTNQYQRVPFQVSYSTSTSGTSGGTNNQVHSFEAQIEPFQVEFDFYRIEEATALIKFKDGSEKAKEFLYEPYKDLHNIDRNRVQHELQGEKIWHVRVEEEDIISVEVEVTYGDGRTEREKFHLEDGTIEERNW